MYRKNTSQAISFAMVTTAGVADAAATIAARRILDAIGPTSTVGNILNEGAGLYTLVMDSTDCNGNTVGLFFTAAGDVPLSLTFPTTAADPTNAASFGITRLDSTISSRMGTFALPANFAALGLSSSGHVSNVDTLQIYTSNTPQSGNAFPSVNTGVAPGAAGGLFISGSNAAATTVGSLIMGGNLSVGGFLIGGVSQIAQTGDAFARLGAAGAGLTALGDTRIANLDSTVSSRMGTFPLPLNFSALAINATGQTTVGTVAAGGIGATSISTAGLNAIADAILDRNMATGVDSGTDATRTVRQSLRTIRNKVDTGAGIVYKEDDATTSYSFSVTTAAGNPITIFDPA